MNPPYHEGLLQLQRSELAALRLIHLLSGMDDEEDGVAADACGRVAAMSGYTEWVSPDASRLTLGWDWQLLPGVGRPQVMRLGLPRTNIQVLDAGLRPLPWDDNLQVLADFIDGIDWSSPAFEAVCQRHVN